MPELTGDFDQTEFERSSFNYLDMSSVFHLKDVNYTRQFAHIYAHRLVQMREILQVKIQQKWGMIIYVIIHVFIVIINSSISISGEKSPLTLDFNIIVPTLMTFKLGIIYLFFRMHCELDHRLMKLLNTT